MKAAILLSILAPTVAFAQSAVREVCASYTSGTCVSARFVSTPDSKTEGQFDFKIQTPDNKIAQNVKVDLWMQMGNHGHGSSPVQLTSLSENTYQVQKAWFVMTGSWQVRVEFQVDEQSYKLILPVQVAQ